MKFLESVWGKKQKQSLAVPFLCLTVGFASGWYLKPVGSPVTPDPVVTQSGGSTQTVQATPDLYADFTFDNLLVRVNEARLSADLPQLATDSYLARQAEDDLEGNCPVTGHGKFRDKYDQGVFKNYKQVAEVLHSGPRETPKQAIDAFLNSPTHKDILLTESFTRVGIGFKKGLNNCVSFILGK